MKRSEERILVTHQGTLPRSAELREMVVAKEEGRPVDEAEFASLAGLGIRTYSGLLAYRTQARANPSLLDEVDPRPLSKERCSTFDRG